jgi:hypothetical protein
VPDVRDLLRAAYSSRGLVLVLGAGVSKASRFPDWTSLLAGVAEDCGERGLVDEIHAGAIPLPVAASVLEKRIGDRSNFVEAVRSVLYRGLPEDVRSGDRTALVKYVMKNTTMSAVASMCADSTPGKKHPYRRNRRIHAIVTFNLDGLLQKYVRARYERRLLRTIERASAGAKRRRINLYHMHGYLRFDAKKGDPRKEAPDAVVLTEQDYFDFFNNPTSMFNYTFLYLLRERPCLFIGLSMEDGNLRRLLHLSAKERLTGFEREGRRDARARAKTKRHVAILRTPGSDEKKRAVRDSLALLGTRVLWVDDYKEIDTELGHVYDARGDWEAVRGV